MTTTETLPLDAPHAAEATLDLEPARASALAPAPSEHDRYEDLGLIASGSFGEVRRVLDRKLARVVAMKVLHAELAARPGLGARLIQEARLTARLQHPGIVGVYDFGERADGRIWITMPEVRGRTLARVIDEVDEARRGGTAGAWTERRVLEALGRVCQAVAFAHQNGVVHRDLKPDNIMVGELGEVYVMDWGLSRSIRNDATAHDATGHDATAHDASDHVPAAELAALLEAAGARDPRFTTDGAVVGTPAYMAPEQARGEVSRHGPAVDIHALGAILYHLLAGRPPYQGSAAFVIARVAAGPPPPIESVARVPDELAAVCRRAMARDPSERFPEASAMAAALFDWLDGLTRRERALAALEAAPSPELGALAERETSLRREAEIALASTPRHAKASAKLAAWEQLDEADRVAQERRLLETRWLTAVHGALALDPTLDAAHAALADHYRAALLEAESSGHHDEAARFETLLGVHDRGRHRAFLEGRGLLSIDTDPPGAIATLHRYEPSHRRLVPRGARVLGPTPIRELALERGSYLVELSRPGGPTVRHPVCIGRGEHWDGRPPGEAEPSPIPLPGTMDLDVDEVYIPAGWAVIGGDPHAPDSLARRRVWIDGFVIARFPVTNQAYLDFLDALLAEGREAEALAACPRSNLGAGPDAEDRLAFPRDRDGRFTLPASDPVQRWTPDSPATLMSHRAATAYAAFMAARTGRPYRLPNELEREKAARGVDGRAFPWGNTCDPSWACLLESHEGEPGRVSVHAFPDDESPYGVRGLAGNTRDFCANLWRREGPPLDGDRLRVTVEHPAEHEHVSVRGGAWSSVESHCRAAARFGMKPDHRRSATGLRLVRSFP
jgi:serine/threonine protein kinase/formylglycine-generating enzyme required for sulfatase activity